MPNFPIGIMHLAAGIWSDGKDMRVDKSIKIDIETLDKNKVSYKVNNMEQLTSKVGILIKKNINHILIY